MPTEPSDHWLGHVLAITGWIGIGLLSGVLVSLVGAFFLRIAAKRAVPALGYLSALITTYLAFVASFATNLVLGFVLESAGIVVSGEMPDEIIMQTLFAMLGILIYAWLISLRLELRFGRSIAIALLTGVLTFLAMMLCATAGAMIVAIYMLVT